MKKEYLVAPVDEALEARTSLQKFCHDVILPKLSEAKRREVTELMHKGMAIDGAMAMCNIKITVN